VAKRGRPSAVRKFEDSDPKKVHKNAKNMRGEKKTEGKSQGHAVCLKEKEGVGLSSF